MLKYKDNYIVPLIMFVFVFYLQPIITNYFYPDRMASLYNMSDMTMTNVIVFISVIFFSFLYSLVPAKRVYSFGRNPIMVNMPNANFILAVFFTLMSIVFYFQYGLKFRHTGENLSKTAGWVIILVFVRTYFKAFLFVSIFNELKEKKRIVSRKTYLLIGVSFYFSMVSSFDVINILAAAIFAFFNRGAILNLFGEKKRVGRLFIPVFVLFAIMGVFFVGTANKIGVERASKEFFSGGMLKEQILRGSLRLSTNYASVSGVIDAYVLEDRTVKEALPGTLTNTFNRFWFLLTGERNQAPDIWTISRANYMNLYHQTNNERTGASPGPIASMFYTGNIFLGFILMTIYLIIIFRILKYGFSSKYKLNFLGYFLCFVFIMPFFESPLDLVNVFNPAFIYVFFSLTSICYLSQENERRIKVNSI